MGLQPLGVARSRIVVRSLRGVEVVPVREVRYFWAEQKYVTIHYGRGHTIARESLSGLEAEFGGRFLRIHRSVLVAVKFIDRLLRPAPRCYELKVVGLSERLPVSRRRAAAVRTVMADRARREAPEGSPEALAILGAFGEGPPEEESQPPHRVDGSGLLPLREAASATVVRPLRLGRQQAVGHLGGRCG